MTTTTTTMIPLGKLTASAKNQRQTTKAPNVETLAASILSLGVLQNLVVSEAEDGTYPVHAGERRWTAMLLLVERGKLTLDYLVPCKVIPDAEATAASLAENMQREAMHPADEFQAFATLRNEGQSIDGIADAFGVSPLVVERRLKLTTAAPELLDAYRRDEISTDQLIALCATENHETQVRVWETYGDMSWANKPADLRRAVLGEEVDVSKDKRIEFIGGLDAYRAAGGEVRRDLFTGDGSGGFATDVVLLDKLVAERLEREAEAVRAEGWSWVDVWPVMDRTAFDRLGRAPKTPRALTEAEAATLARLEKERDDLNAEQEAMHAKAEEAGRDDLTDDERERDDEIERRQWEITEEIEDLSENAATYSPDVIAKAGALVIFEGGKARIERGMVKTADRKAVAEAAGEAVKGGRETEAAGRKDGSALSDSLRRSLLGHRNLAAQIETAKRPDVAKLVLGAWTVQYIRERIARGYRGIGAPTNLHISETACGTRNHHPIADDAGIAKAEAFAKECAEQVAKLPKDEDALWDALAAMSSEEIDALNAYGIALSVSLSTKHDDLTAKLLGSLDFDMSAHFTPTAGNYLGRVSKELIVDAIKEGGKLNGEADKAALLGMKKSDLAAEAEKRLAGTGWVPKTIRAPKPKKPAQPKAEAKAEAKAKPAAKATKAPAKAKAKAAA